MANDDDTKKRIRIVNLGIVPEVVYKAFVGSTDLANVSAGDGSFTLGYRAMLDNGTPILKFYNNDQNKFMDGFVDWSRRTEMRLGTGSTPSRLVAGFAAGEHLFKKTRRGNKSCRAGERYENAADVPELSRLLYDVGVRSEYSHVLGSIPATLSEEFEKSGVATPGTAEVLPNVLDTLKYFVDRVFELGDPKKAVDEFRNDWPTLESYSQKTQYTQKTPYSSRKK